jgi:hypothetical protein
MAHKYEHPFRVQPGMLAPVFQTQRQAHDFLAEDQARGAIRRCAHARVRGTGSGGWTEGYAVYCEKDSFEIVQMAPAAGLGIGDRSRGFSGCPADCRLYRPRWRATLSRWRDSIRHALWWLDRQSWQVKVALIALPLLVVAAYFGVLRDLATLVRAIGEVWRGH